MRRFWLWAPLAGFVVFVTVVAMGLYWPDDRKHPSKLIGKPIPTFALEPGATGRPGLASSDFAAGPRLVNVFASWCVPCITEAPVLAELARQGAVIDGIAIRDRQVDVDQFLARYGNPYRAIGSDPTSQVQISLGSSGVPETFVVDARGIVRYQHIGEITPDEMPAILGKLGEAQ